MYVVGFIGDDGALGQTLQCESESEIESAAKLLAEQHGDEDVLDEIAASLVEGTVFSGEFGNYFCGILESL